MSDLNQGAKHVKDDVVDDVAKHLYGITKKDSLEHQICIQCRSEHLRFDDEPSRKEYEISGLCQACQDKLFYCAYDDLYDSCKGDMDSAMKRRWRVIPFKENQTKKDKNY